MIQVGVITFPGSNCDKDIGYVVENNFDCQLRYIWHKEHFGNKEFDLVILPGGFSYGDYLRCGAIARFSPAMQSLKEHANSGRMVLGICNGFQILTEAGLLPGALALNLSMKYVCKTVELKKGSENNSLTSHLRSKNTLKVPIAHGEGRYYADPDTIKKLEDQNCIFFRYTENPNGSVDDIAGVTSPNYKIAGLMPHPERAMDPLTKNTDGKFILEPFFALQ